MDLIIIRMMKAGPTELTPALLSSHRDLQALRSTSTGESASSGSMDLEYAAALSKEDKLKHEKKWSMASESSSLSDDPVPAYSP